ncbi:ComF family protein [Anaerospora sp.]|uniref:ComF family protein n=1 Tax=Anaerospora sp. TaxID=1960278 RepID=UPI0028A26D69|nr:ComF family protein [Anaerospora sp.]
MLKSLWEAFLDLLFPPRCPVCRTFVDQQGEWCSSCLTLVWAPRELELASHGVTALDACFVLCDYTAGVQKLIRDMKFRKGRRYGCYLTWLLSRYQNYHRLGSVNVIVPVPLSPERLKDRGYNQTEVIFRPWAESRQLLWCDALIRLKATLPQWELTIAERRKNVKGAFQVTRPEVVQDKQILLVDDIFTTGTTMNECAKVLKKAGAKRVVGLTIASGAQ